MIFGDDMGSTCIRFAALKNKTMLKQLLVGYFTGLCMISSAQLCAVNLDFNHNSNNLIGFFDAQVMSHCEVLDYYWDFGDDAQSSLSSPVHTFPSAGVYLVCLSVVMAQDGGNEIYSYCESISIGMATPCSLNAHPNLQSIDEILFAHSASSAGINTQLLSHEWDFGDGTIATGEDAVHHYQTLGTYTVCLTVNGMNGNQTCSSTACKPHVFDLDFPEVNTFFSLEDLGACEFKANSETILLDDLILESRIWTLNGEEFSNEALVFEWSSLNGAQELCMRETFSFYGELQAFDYCIALDEICESTATSVEQAGSEEKQTFIAGNGTEAPQIISNQILGRIQVYTMEGKLIFETKCSDRKLRFNQLESGAYILRLNQAQSFPLIIQK